MRYISVRRRRIIGNSFIYISLIVICVGIIIPFLWMISTSFKQPDEIFSSKPKWLPKEFNFDNFVGIWTRKFFLQCFKNSIIISITTMVATIIVATLAGYGISRFQFKGRLFFSILLIVVQIFPGMLMIIPLFTIMNKLHLIDTYIVVVIAHCTFALPFCTWMLKGYFDTVPTSFEEAALLDGCNRLQVLYRIIMPLALPGIIAVAMFAFVLSWQEYLFALTLTRSEQARTLVLAIAMMQGQHGSVNWGEIMAGSIIACIPGLVIFLLLERYLIQGFTSGGVKG